VPSSQQENGRARVGFVASKSHSEKFFAALTAILQSEKLIAPLHRVLT